MLSGKATAIILGVLLLVAFSLFGSPLLQTVWRGLNEITYCVVHDCDPSGPASSWEDLFAAASEAATKIDSRAFPVNISALPAAHNEEDWSPEKALSVRFTFSTPDGTDILVSLIDTSPSTTLDVFQTDRVRFSPFSRDSQYTPETLSETVRSIMVSPRQVVSITWPLASAQANKRLQKVHPVISFDPLLYQGTLSKADVWSASYWTSLKDTPLSSAFSSGFAVDKATGDLLGRKYYLSDPLLPTPTTK
jgi:hypothetical protein